MIHKPKFINKIQRIHAGAVRLVKLDPATTAAADGSFPVDAFPPGLAPMAEDDWRQFRMTSENAVKMVDTANQAIAAGKKLRYNYGHDRSGPIAGQIVRAEITPGGGVRSLVNWTARASASIQSGEWEGTSPEFYARVVQDENGDPIEENGRVLMEPFELVGGALDNDPAMPDLAIAANSEPERPEEGKGEIMETKKLAAMLGLPETATNEDCEKALEAKPKPTPAVMEPPVAVAAATVADITAIRAELSALTASKTIDAALAQGVADRKITPGLLETAKTVAKHGGSEGLKSFIDSLPASAPAGGSIAEKAIEKRAGIPDAPNMADHVGGSLHAFKAENGPVHQLAVAYIDKAEIAGRHPSYREAVVAVTRKTA